MSEAPVEQEASTENEAAAQEAEPETFTREYVENLRKENAKYRTKASENSEAAKTAEKARLEAMSDQDRAIEEARQTARSEATTSFSKRLARTEFDALAARRNASFDSASALEYVDLGKFLGEDGEPDTKAIEAAVERLVPAPTDAAPSFDGGTRTTPPAPQGMTGLIRKAAGRA